MIRHTMTTIGAAAGLMAATPVLAQNDSDNAAPEDTVNCVSLARVEDTEVLDESSILFRMRGGDVYRNDLPHRCPGLEADSTFMYRVTTPQLCSVDVITVLDNFGSRFMPGVSCGLGRFQTISEDEAAELIRVAESGEDLDE